MTCFHAEEHFSLLKTEVRAMMSHESYWNIIIFCRDGTVAHNRMLVGLVFPQVSDEISVICPDHDMEDIADMINNLLQPSEEQERLVSSREKLELSHVYHTHNSVFQAEQNFSSETGSASEENNW